MTGVERPVTQEKPSVSPVASGEVRQQTVAGRAPGPRFDTLRREDECGEVLHIGVRAGEADQVQIWALDNGNGTCERAFRVFGTGHPLPDDVIYRGTALALGGDLVWHVFEAKP